MPEPIQVAAAVGDEYNTGQPGPGRPSLLL